MKNFIGAKVKLERREDLRENNNKFTLVVKRKKEKG